MEMLAPYFDKMTFRAKKETKRAEYRTLYTRLNECANNVMEALVHKEPSFSAVPVHYFEHVALDASVVRRQEFVLKCNSNSHLAYVGDAFLTWYLAKTQFISGSTQKEYQDCRNDKTSNDSLAVYFDNLFERGTYILVWEDEPSVRQKASFVEALIGMLSMCGHLDLANNLCKELCI